MRRALHFLIAAAVLVLTIFAFYYINRYRNENRILKEIVSLLEADSRVAQVLVTKVEYDQEDKKVLTTIKFLEFDSKGKPLSPRYFTFAGNIIQFQSLVIRFDDIFVKSKHPLKGKSAYLFWKVFMLDGSQTREYEITRISEIPRGYRRIVSDLYEEKLWAKFWDYALSRGEAEDAGVKNAQIEAPGTMFIPGMLYTIKIEHDGGMRIDVEDLPEILKGEKIP